MASNRGVAYIRPGEVEVQSIDYPELALGSRQCQHGVILKIVATNICGSDQHMVRGRTTAPAGLVLGHEITGEIVEKGRDVEFLDAKRNTIDAHCVVKFQPFHTRVIAWINFNRAFI